MAYTEYKGNGQNNYGWNLTWEATGKFPIVAKRIWSTLADAQAYIDNASDTACIGLQLSVVQDPNEENNGIYFVKSIGDGTNPGVLEKSSGGSKATIDYDEETETLTLTL